MALSCSLLFGCGSAKDEKGLFSDGTTQNAPTCDTSGTWATLVIVGVGWQSTTIAPGAGIVKQWILTNRKSINGVPQDIAQACGIGAKDVPLGSAWFHTAEFPNIPSEWTGVRFLSNLFDDGRLPQFDLAIHLQSASTYKASVGDAFDTPATPFQFGVEGLGPDAPWPTIADIAPYLVDHDGDNHPGLTGLPYEGPVPGEPEGTVFMDPRLDLNDISGASANPARASALYMAIRTRASLQGKLVSCNPPRLEGEVADGSLLIETRNIGCTVAGTNTPCDATQIQFIDSNLPKFEGNGESRTVSLKVPDSTTCAEVRKMDFGIE